MSSLVYRALIRDVAWVYKVEKHSEGFDRHARDQPIVALLATLGQRNDAVRGVALVIVPATGGRGFSRLGVQGPLILFKISGIVTGYSLDLQLRTGRRLPER